MYTQQRITLREGGKLAPWNTGLQLFPLVPPVVATRVGRFDGTLFDKPEAFPRRRPHYPTPPLPAPTRSWDQESLSEARTHLIAMLLMLTHFDLVVHLAFAILKLPPRSAHPLPYPPWKRCFFCFASRSPPPPLSFLQAGLVQFSYRFLPCSQTLVLCFPRPIFSPSFTQDKNP